MRTRNVCWLTSHQDFWLIWFQCTEVSNTMCLISFNSASLTSHFIIVTISHLPMQSLAYYVLCQLFYWKYFFSFNTNYSSYYINKDWSGIYIFSCRLYSHYYHLGYGSTPEDFEVDVSVSIRYLDRCRAKSSLRSCIYNRTLFKEMPVSTVGPNKIKCKYTLHQSISGWPRYNGQCQEEGKEIPVSFFKW